MEGVWYQMSLEQGVLSPPFRGILWFISDPSPVSLLGFSLSGILGTHAWVLPAFCTRWLLPNGSRGRASTSVLIQSLTVP